jgi:hypothetical protein
VGHKVFVNECNATFDGLTSWNGNERFPSLGVGHFIWYPKGIHERFRESFPEVLTFLQQHDEKLPSWLTPTMACPWSSQAEFKREFNGVQLTELREFLGRTEDKQYLFLAHRLEEAMTKIEDDPGKNAAYQKYLLLTATDAGIFALIDYVNFKGDGLDENERYGEGKGWGLLQVLEGMQGSPTAKSAPAEFARSAEAVLRRRVENAPPERNEKQNLPGWLSRVRRYGASGSASHSAGPTPLTATHDSADSGGATPKPAAPRTARPHVDASSPAAKPKPAGAPGNQGASPGGVPLQRFNLQKPATTE